MDEMDGKSVDRGSVVKQSVEVALGRPPVACRLPMFTELTQHLEWQSLRPVGDGFPAGPSRCRKPAVQITEVCLRRGDPKRLQQGHRSIL